MNCIRNFLIVSRLDSSSRIEKVGDFFLSPARVLLGGKRVMVFQNVLVNVREEGAYLSSNGSWVRTALKITIALASLPFIVLGGAIKLFCLTDSDYRAFCTKEISQASTCHPKLFEMFQHVHSTADFVDKYRGELVFKPLGLSECSCSGTGAFHRLNNPRRNNLENGIVRRLVDIHEDKTAPIKLISMGSGGLMSDFITLEKLFLAGFKNIEIHCVDPEEIKPDQVQKIKEFFGGYKEISLSISSYTDIDQLPAGRRDYCAVLAVDYDVLADFSLKMRFKGLSDLMKARSRLGDSGFLALGFINEDTLSGKGMDPVILTGSASASQSLITDLTQYFMKNDELFVAVPYLSFEGTQLLMYALAIAAEKAPDRYGKISVSWLDDKNSDALEEFKNMLSSLFPKAEIQVSIHQEGQKYDLLFTGSLESEVESGKYLDLLKQDAFTYLLYPMGHMYRQVGNKVDERIQII